MFICPAGGTPPHGRPGRLPRIAWHVTPGVLGMGTGGLQVKRPLRQPRHQRW